MGHSRLEMTMDLYTGSVSAVLENAAARLEGVFQERPNPCRELRRRATGTHEGGRTTRGGWRRLDERIGLEIGLRPDFIPFGITQFITLLGVRTCHGVSPISDFRNSATPNVAACRGSLTIPFCTPWLLWLQRGGCPAGMSQLRRACLNRWRRTASSSCL